MSRICLAVCAVFAITVPAYSQNHYPYSLNHHESPRYYKMVKGTYPEQIRKHPDSGFGYEVIRNNVEGGHISNSRTAERLHEQVNSKNEPLYSIVLGDKQEDGSLIATYEDRKSGNKPQFRNYDVSSDNNEVIGKDETSLWKNTVTKKFKLIPEIPQTCEKLGICEDVPNYPHKYIEDKIKRAGDLKFFNLDMLTPDKLPHNDFVHEEDLCRSQPMLIYPKAARNTQGKWVFIVNVVTSRQGFEFEKCLNPGKPCDKAYPENKYELMCGQNRDERKMWALDEEGRIGLQDLSLPSCCTCKVIEKKKPYPFF